jgi:transmembrane sensor
MNDFPKNPLRRLAYAAVLVGLVCILFFMWTRYRTSLARITKPEIQIHTLFVANGDQSELSLSDGTRVTLDSGSSFQYPEDFGAQVREVYLDGEALFDVPPDKKRPFVVVAQDTRIRVLSTRFNVRAWKRARSVEVAVDQGSVSFGPEQENGPAPVIISEGFVSRIDQGQPPAEPQPVDMEKYLGWLRREADFQNVRVSEILSQLERWYNIKFILLDKAIAFEQLTVFIDSRPIDEILELIAALTAQAYERTGNLVVLGPDNRN